MTDTEKRRSELLAQTRARYSEKYTPPAIHPRYGNVYYSLYHNEDEAQSGNRIGSFGVRVVIALILFGAFIFADYQGMDDAKMVSEEISQDYTESFSEVFNFLDEK